LFLWIHLLFAQRAARFGRGGVSARKATQACLDRIAAVDGKIHAFLSYDATNALAQADAADQAIIFGATHAKQPLLGIPVGIKDVIAVKDQPLSCASKILGKFVS